MEHLTNQLPDWSGYAAWVGYALIEYWLGKTTSVKSGSTLEMVLNGAKGVLGLIKKEPAQK